MEVKLPGKELSITKFSWCFCGDHCT